MFSRPARNAYSSTGKFFFNLLRRLDMMTIHVSHHYPSVNECVHCVTAIVVLSIGKNCEFWG